MAFRPLLILSTAILAAVIALTVWTWVQIPDNALVATHWPADGQLNGHMHKFPGLVIVPFVMAGLLAGFWAITRIEPRHNNLVRSRALFAVGLFGGLGVAALGQAHIVMTALGSRAPATGFILPAVAILAIAIGNVIGKSRANFFLGVRTPWTIESDHAWEKTNRWAGRFLILSGIVTLAALATLRPAFAVGVLIATLLASAATSVFLSYFFWREDPDRHGHDSVPE